MTDTAIAHGSPAAVRRRGDGWTATALLTPATIFVAISLFAPLAILFRYSLNEFIPAKKLMVEALTLANYVKFFTDPYYTAILGTTVKIAVLVTLICLVLGFPLAYVVARTQSRWKHLLIILIVLPLFVGNSVRAAGWMVVFGSKGFVNATLMGIGLIDRPLEIMFTENAVIIGIIAVNLPFMVLSLQSVIEGIDRAVEEAAFSLGAPPATMFRRVLWPLAMPGRLRHAVPAGRPAVQDDGAAGLQPVHPADQLAIRRRHRLRADGSDLGADARRQPDPAAQGPGLRGPAPSRLKLP